MTKYLVGFIVIICGLGQFSFGGDCPNGLCKRHREVIVSSTTTIVKPIEEIKGGHPLNNDSRRPTLENLLNNSNQQPPVTKNYRYKAPAKSKDKYKTKKR